jgi:putative ATP-dependent endonuclease of OLD family
VRLETARFKNYRSCRETTVRFSKYLTLLVGENDAGKSNIIDGLRVVIPPASGRTTLWFDDDRDVTYGVGPQPEIEIRRTYSDLTANEDAFYVPALVDQHRKLVHTTRHLTDPAVPRRQRLIQTVGEDAVPDPEPENRDRIAHVYLPPLRDAATALDSAGGNRLAEMIRVIASEPEITASAATFCTGPILAPAYGRRRLDAHRPSGIGAGLCQLALYRNGCARTR